ncbi:MAG: hypothetical protein K0R90_903 [Oscillospiraceae bacterium]|nr:hypothetical protein [Oscillospiraceae bacterium]
MDRLKKRKLKFAFIKMLCVFLVLLLIVFTTDRMFRPTIKTIAGYRAQVIATKAINDSFYNTINNIGFTYKDLVAVSKNEDGTVSSIETNIININHLKSNITSSILENMSKITRVEMKVPLGTLLGTQVLSGHGPGIEFRLIPSGSVKTQLISKFESTGINQTLHQIIMNIQVTISAVIPGYTTTVTVPSNFIIAETIIVGVVPEYYTQIISEDQELLDKTNAYDKPIPNLK